MPTDTTAAVAPRYLCPPFKPMWKVLPARQHDEGWCLEAFYMSARQVESATLNSRIRGEDSEVIGLQPSHYMRLLTPDGDVMMSDAAMERRTNLELIEKAHGRVLIAGLGIGMVLIPLLHNPKVTSITVLENTPAIIRMVEPHLRAWYATQSPERAAEVLKLQVLEADVWQWKLPLAPTPEEQYNTIYFDIWPTIRQVAEDAKKLMRRYKRMLATGDEHAWMEAWRRWDSLRMNR